MWDGRLARPLVEGRQDARPTRVLTKLSWQSADQTADRQPNQRTKLKSRCKLQSQTFIFLHNSS
ncbi:hypothetical protein GXM_05237 [Nostoc sphaeroides CCNUC1]|uniref:Uncharacterized protein n=1 Tax=Nostoc sphaeroides CCNUC1 TaxID=2653204 RepID=A0A5P8W4T0_9NOSO|nr:hypothetical protein GXM_05237 [Nostoc sphaeroides CCNUC1]